MSHNETSSTGCPISAVLPHDPVPFFSNGDVNFKAHDVGWLCCGIMAIVATITSLWLISKHLAFFYHPTEQRHIVRLLLMPVIYALCSFLSYYFYKQALYFQLLRDCYEAFVIAAFFFLLLSYLSNPPPTPADPCPRPYATKAERNAKLRSVFRDLHLKKWRWPLGWLRWRPAGGGPGEGEVSTFGRFQAYMLNRQIAAIWRDAAILVWVPEC
ncbi:OSTA/TMEM184 family protein [Rhodotorula paludigena]|uniref:OSTA/TMEM184 family protein n=1 Tax=Rhodotorula paludigena TaxID=86838 RepID=UPI003177DE18